MARRGNQQLVDASYPTVRFSDRAQYDKFQKHKVRMLNTSRFVDRNTLQILGIDEQTREFFNNVGFGSCFNMMYGTYASLTYEFLSSFEKRKTSNGIISISFRLNNILRYVELDMISEIFGFKEGGLRVKPKSFNPRELWNAIAGTRDVNTQHMKISIVHHPSIRYFLKFLGHFFGRSETSQCRTGDLMILASYLWQAQFPQHVDLAYLLVNALENVAKQEPTFDEDGDVTYSTPIWIGGVITHFAVYFGEPENRPQRMGGNMLLDLNHLANAGHCIVMGRNSIQWLIGEQYSLILPSNHVPAIVPNRANYLLPLDDVGLPPIPLRTYVRHTGPSSGPSSSSQPSSSRQHDESESYDPSFQSSVMTSLDQITMGIGRLSSRQDDLSTRLDHFSARQDEMWHLQQKAYEDQRLAMHPIYDFAYRQGMISPRAPHPSWYTPPTAPPVPHYGFQGDSFTGWAPGRGYGQDASADGDAGTSGGRGKQGDSDNDDDEDDEDIQEIDRFQFSGDD